MVENVTGPGSIEYERVPPVRAMIQQFRDQHRMKLDLYRVTPAFKLPLSIVVARLLDFSITRCVPAYLGVSRLHLSAARVATCFLPLTRVDCRMTNDLFKIGLLNILAVIVGL